MKAYHHKHLIEYVIFGVLEAYFESHLYNIFNVYEAQGIDANYINKPCQTKREQTGSKHGSTQAKSNAPYNTSKA